jgi:hypothetical protein
MEAPFQVQLPRASAAGRGRARHLEVSERFSVQVFMWNPADFPENPEQYTRGYDVTVYSNGTYSAVPFGSKDDMDIQIETVTLPDGRRFLRFPFQINGLGG